MKYSQIVGWILLVAGVILIGWTLISSYNIFTGRTEAPAIFKIETKETLTPTKGEIPTTQAELQEEMEKMITEQLKGVLPADSITKLLDLVVCSMLTFILIFGGSQISGLGIKLITRAAAKGGEEDLSSLTKK